MTKRILITGATSGIGKALAHHFAAEGYHLIAHGRSPEKLQALSEEIRLAYDLTIDTVCLELTKTDALKSFIEKCQIDILINNAGLSHVGASLGLTDEEELEIIQVNYITSFLLTKWAMRKMLAQGHGIVVNICSTSSLMQVPYLSTYSATKKALYSYTLTLNQEIKRYQKDVHLIAICPGPTKSGLLDQQENQFSQTGYRLLNHQMSADYVARKIARAIAKKKKSLIIGPMDRIGIPLLNLLPVSWHGALVEKIFGKILSQGGNGSHLEL